MMSTEQLTEDRMTALVAELMTELDMMEPFFELFAVVKRGDGYWWIALEDRRIIVGSQMKRIQLAHDDEGGLRSTLRVELLKIEQAH